MANLTERKKGVFTPCIHLDAAKFYISVVAAAQMCWCSDRLQMDSVFLMGAIKSDYKFADLSGGTYAFGCIQHKTGRT